MASVSIRGLGKDKASTGKAAGTAAGGGGRVNRILGAIDLEVQDGEFLVLVGPSGCGKTTLLRCVAGLERPTRGELFIDGKRVTDVEPQDRDIAMVFQSYALYPTMTVRDNMSFALRMKKAPAADIVKLVDDAAAMLEITHLLERYPRELSGGQRQRVAMGRAVVRRPQVFLFDEPLSNLDAALRQQMRVELLRLHQRLRRTMIYVTHDQVEAMTLADRIAVMDRGALRQVSAPQEIYNRPQNLFVASFLGTPEMNTYAGEIRAGRFVAPGLTLALPAAADGAVTLGVRAEGVTLSAVTEPGSLPAQVEAVEQLGWENLLHLRLGAGEASTEAPRLLCRCEAQRSPRRGEAVGVRVTTEQVHLFQRGGDRDGERIDNRGAEAALAI